MNDSLVKRFLPRFIESSLARLKRIGALLDAGQSENISEIALELHSLAGDASVLGFQELAAVARGLEAGVLAGDSQPGELRGAMQTLAARVEGLTAD